MDQGYVYYKMRNEIKITFVLQSNYKFEYIIINKIGIQFKL